MWYLAMLSLNLFSHESRRAFEFISLPQLLELAEDHGEIAQSCQDAEELQRSREISPAFLLLQQEIFGLVQFFEEGWISSYGVSVWV